MGVLLVEMQIPELSFFLDSIKNCYKEYSMYVCTSFAMSKNVKGYILALSPTRAGKLFEATATDVIVSLSNS